MSGYASLYARKLGTILEDIDYPDNRKSMQVIEQKHFVVMGFTSPSQTPINGTLTTFHEVPRPTVNEKRLEQCDSFSDYRGCSIAAMRRG